ncbi:MAG: hypothetical protein R3254_02305 [Thiomicrorhabdus sp.]|nr:hypothetical protein [Thiomicrorhabdus sp.]
MISQKQTQMNKSNSSRDNHEQEEWSFITWQKRALFLCKRGNLETELLLQNYILSLTPPSLKPSSLKPYFLVDDEVSRHSQHTSSPLMQKIKLIDALLLESEQNLFNWLLHTPTSTSAPSTSPPTRYLQLIQEIRDNYLNSNR